MWGYAHKEVQTMLKKITGRIIRAVKAVCYGPEGIGKSTLASQAPDPVFIDLDDGTTQLDVARVEPPRTWESLLALILEIAATPGFCKTLILDTADKAEMLCSQYICSQHRVDGIESIGYGKGYTYLQEEFNKLLTALDQVIAAGINVIILAHAKMRKMELPDEAGAFDRWELKLTKQVAPLVKEWADALLFCNYKTFIVSSENSTKKAQGGKRVIYTSHHPCWDAKSRIGLPEEMEMAYTSIAPLFNESPHDVIFRWMQEAGISDTALRLSVSKHGFYPIEIPISQYPEEFVTDVLLANWVSVVKEVLISYLKKENNHADKL